MKTSIQIQRLNAMLRLFLERLTLELSGTQELFALLAKSAKQPLTESERIQVRSQLLNLLKIATVLILLVLPFSFVTMPLIYKVVPKHVLMPSAFLS